MLQNITNWGTNWVKSNIFLKGLKTFGHLNGHYLNVNNLKSSRVFSSVGLERYLDRVKVGGSNPSTPTKIHKDSQNKVSFFLCLYELYTNCVEFLPRVYKLNK